VTRPQRFELDGTQDTGIYDMPARPDDEEVAQAMVEDDLRRQPRIAAAED
jgi:hypothetical protein